MEKFSSIVSAGLFSLALLLSANAQDANVKPTVSFLSPDRDFASYIYFDVTVVADADDSDGTIENVNLVVYYEYTGEEFSYDVTSAPYEFEAISFGSPGKYILTLISTDNEGAKSEPAVRVIEAFSMGLGPGPIFYEEDTTSPPTRTSTGAPTITNVEISIEEGPSYASAYGDVVTLTVNVEEDPRRNGLSYYWWQVSGPVALKFDEESRISSSATITGFSGQYAGAHTYAGTYTFEVAVNDGLNSTQKTVSVTYITLPAAHFQPANEIIFPKNGQYVDTTKGFPFKAYVDTSNCKVLRVYLQCLTVAADGKIDVTYSVEDFMDLDSAMHFYDFTMGNIRQNSGHLQLFIEYEKLVNGAVETDRFMSRRVGITISEGPDITDLAGNSSFAFGRIKTANVPIKLNEQTTLTVDAVHPNNDDLIYSWRQIGGPVVVNIEDGATASAKVGRIIKGRGGFFVKGDYIFEVAVADERRVPTDSRSSIVECGLVTVSVTDEPLAPVAKNFVVHVVKGTSIDITLMASDANGDELTYEHDSPSIGTLVGDSPELTYTAGLTNEDTSFTYTATDGTHTSNVATVTIQVWDELDPDPHPGCGIASTTERHAGTAWLIVLVVLGLFVRRRQQKYS